jgi:hypothetical protein
MKSLIIYTKDKQNAEKTAIKIIKIFKKTQIILQNNIEILFIYKKKLCKEKKCKITIINNNIKTTIIKKLNKSFLLELKK